jgi:hypothetical protein
MKKLELKTSFGLQHRVVWYIQIDVLQDFTASTTVKKRRPMCSRLHDATFKMTVTFKVVAVKTTNLSDYK